MSALRREVEELCGQVDQLKRQLSQLMSKTDAKEPQSAVGSIPAAGGNVRVISTTASSTGRKKKRRRRRRRPPDACWTCGARDHYRATCPTKPATDHEDVAVRTPEIRVMAVRKQLVITGSSATLNAGSTRASTQSLPASDTARQSEKHDEPSVRPQRRRLEAQPQLMDKVKPYLADPPQSWLPAPSIVTTAPNSPTVGAVPFVTLPAHDVASDEPDEQNLEEIDYESQESFEADESPTQGPDDTIVYDFDMAADSDSTLSKSRELTLLEISERLDRLSEQLAREQYEVDDSPVQPRRPARTHRLPSRYRD
ncbi:MAG TPA: hypothetical protein VLS45_08695 [Methylomicrobium sp.]|nr:hypothetical protein [Methylomicrobium sp.]